MSCPLLDGQWNLRGALDAGGTRRCCRFFAGIGSGKSVGEAGKVNSGTSASDELETGVVGERCESRNA